MIEQFISNYHLLYYGAVVMAVLYMPLIITTLVVTKTLLSPQTAPSPDTSRGDDLAPEPANA